MKVSESQRVQVKTSESHRLILDAHVFEVLTPAEGGKEVSEGVAGVRNVPEGHASKKCLPLRGSDGETIT